jgi:hypothetical protein
MGTWIARHYAPCNDSRESVAIPRTFAAMPQTLDIRAFLIYLIIYPQEVK